jgi:anti-sigma factor RsiW
VPDLAAQGFALLGGRVDVVGHDPVATIVYKHAAHTVSLTTLRPGQSVSEQMIAGYNVRSWSDPNFTYVAVSDLPGADLVAFERAFSAAAPTPEIK